MQHTTSLTRTRRRRNLGAVVLVGTLALAACGDDDASEGPSESNAPGPDDKTPDDGIALLTGGEQDKFVLAPQYEQGQESRNEITLGLDVSAGGQDVSVGMTMVLDQRVTEQTEESTTVEATLQNVEVTDAPAGGEEQIKSEMDAIVGETFVSKYDENGQPIGEVELKGGGALPEQMEQGLNANSQAAFPTEEVGVRSTWSQVISSENQGFKLELTTVYELTEVTDDEFVITMTQDTPIDQEVQGQDVSGELTGSGELRISRANPLLVQADYGSDTSAEADGQSLDLHIDLDMSST